MAERTAQGAQRGQDAASGPGVKQRPEGFGKCEEHRHRRDQHETGGAVTGPQDPEPLFVRRVLALRALWGGLVLCRADLGVPALRRPFVPASRWRTRA